MGREFCSFARSKSQQKMNLPKIYLRSGREEAIRRFHPWVFSGAVARTEGEPIDGDVVEVLDKKGVYLATGQREHPGPHFLFSAGYSGCRVLDRKTSGHPNDSHRHFATEYQLLPAGAW
jgi:23S rRNA G2069 N7-methylase RlmK/C1962 C5-methylase RlmI